VARNRSAVSAATRMSVVMVASAQIARV
jgi:hypothetical protein